MGNIWLRVWGMGVWCLLGAACLARVETDGDGALLREGSPPHVDERLQHVPTAPQLVLTSVGFSKPS
ncbi:MAG TPA: hypothetical protein VFS67_06435 [Polyangiaceae bacterium]|nr:hypothetical protein [Polyangiaceae bacterium]